MKKLLAILLALCMVFALVACGNSDSDSGSDADEEEAVVEEKADEEEEETPAEEASASDGENAVLKIGGLVNQTGWFATYDYNNALEMQCLADYYNNQGGITIGDTTYTIEVVVQDGQSDTAGIRTAAQLLAEEDDLHYVIETNDFWVAGALDIFEDAGIMNIMSQENLNFEAMGPQWQYSYNFYNSCPAQYSAALEFVKQMYPDATTVVFCSNDDGNSDAYIAQTKTACEEAGLEYIDQPVIYDAEATDFSSTALQVISSGADIFIGNGDISNIGSILKEVRNNGSDMVCAAVAGSNASMLLEACGLSDVSRAFTLGSDLDNPENNTDIFNEVYDLFKEEYGEDTASSWCGASIQNMYTLLQLMVGAGSVEVADVQAYYDSITEIDTLFGTGTICGTETFGVNHVVSHPNSISYLEDGVVTFGGTVDCYVP